MKKWMKIMVSLMLSIALAMAVLGCEDPVIETEIIPMGAMPVAIATLDLEMGSLTTIDVGWSEVVGANNYELEYIVNDRLIDVYEGGSNTQTIGGLVQNDVVTVSARAINNGPDGEIQKGPAISKTLKMAKPEISGLTVKATTAGTITLGWDAAVNNALTYTCNYAIASRAPGAGITGSETSLSATGAVISDLAPGMAYNIVVTAVNVFGTSDALMIEAKTELTMATPELTVKSTDFEDFSVIWNPIDGATHYNIYYDETNSKGKISVTQAATTITIPPADLSAETTYYIWVEALNSDNGAVSAAGTTSATTTELKKPVVVELAGTTKGNFRVQWNNSYSSAVYYTLVQATDGTINSTFKDVSNHGSAYNGGSLPPLGPTVLSAGGSANTDYYIWVKMVVGSEYVISDRITVRTLP